MTSDAQINANRCNARKSTGPRTKEGKAIVAQNAIQHGLFACQDVMAEEDPRQYQDHCSRLLAELCPADEKEGLMARRIVSLAWRLQRAERLQNEMFNYLLAQELEQSMYGFADVMNAKDIERMHASAETDPKYVVGRMLAKDYEGEKKLDRLSLHERRIEGSLFRTMDRLDRLQAKRSLETPVETQDLASGEGIDTNDPCSAEQSQLAGQGPGGLRNADFGLRIEGSGSPCAKQSQFGAMEGGQGPADETVEQSQSGAWGPENRFAQLQDIVSLQAADVARSNSAKQSQFKASGGGQNRLG